MTTRMVSDCCKSDVYPILDEGNKIICSQCQQSCNIISIDDKDAISMVNDAENQMYHSILQCFGTQIRVDTALHGNGHYIAVSQEAYDKIKHLSEDNQ